MVCYAGCSMWCICKIWQGMIEPGLNLEIQVCHWKGEVILVEIYIKITESDAPFGNGKQNKYVTGLRLTTRDHLNASRTTCYITLTWQKKYMTGIHSRCLTNDEHWAMANSLNIRFKQAWQKCKRYQVTDLVKIERINPPRLVVTTIASTSPLNRYATAC